MKEHAMNRRPSVKLMRHKGQELYDLWNNNDKCPPTLMQSQTWVTAFMMKSAAFTEPGRFRIEFLCRPSLSYTIQFRDSLTSGTWQNFVANGTQTPTGSSSGLHRSRLSDQWRTGHLSRRRPLLGAFF
jgi:hypothetical protein